MNMLRYYNSLGIDRIVISPDLNRDLDTLANMVEYSDAAIEIMLNEGCLFRCPYKPAHHRFNAHKTRGESSDSEKENFRYVDLCGEMCLNDPQNIIQSPFVRPEDMGVYKDIGIEHFKIAGRNMPKEWILKVVRAYQQGEYDGNILDLLNSKDGGKH